MIYRLHVCREPIDPRRREFDSLDAFHDAAGAVAESSSLIEIAEEVFKRLPDAVCMPVQVKIGSGDPFMIGILPSVYHPRDAGNVIPFAGFVRAEATHDGEKFLIKRNRHFDRRAFRTPVKHAPSGSRIVKSELRASDLETPTPGEATIWRDGERLFVHMEVGGGEISIELPAATVAGLAPTPTLTLRKLYENADPPEHSETCSGCAAYAHAAVDATIEALGVVLPL